MQVKATIAAIASLFLASVPAGAQEWFSPGYFDNWAFSNQAADMLRRSQKQIFRGNAGEALRRPQAPSRTAAPAVPPITRDQVQRIAGRLAGGFPANERDKASRIFVELYGKYGQLERQLGLRPGDPAGAAAALIAASYMAHADADLGEAEFGTLYSQLRVPVAAAQDAGFQAVEAQVTMAILAAYLAATREALKERPDPARSAELRRAGGSYLRELLGVEPSKVRIGSAGLELL
ncbi:hypothetical protein C7I55_11515 [Sphingomonas deserti]|uniref:DUF885 domain-containing protein n=1 Tax=Allosphingosinicella deserti TaxID=2116704 RepID=A0A2P7QSF5_9SPHN|nr:hypothetical protein C7I55_11515 [Sphingomonas deserti]